MLPSVYMVNNSTICKGSAGGVYGHACFLVFFRCTFWLLGSFLLGNCKVKQTLLQLCYGFICIEVLKVLLIDRW